MGIMMNIFIATQMIKVLHAPICIYSAEGDVIQCLEENNGKKLIEKEDFSIEISKTIPCIYVKENGVAFCLMWVKEEGYFLGLGQPEPCQVSLVDFLIPLGVGGSGDVADLGGGQGLVKAPLVKDHADVLFQVFGIGQLLSPEGHSAVVFSDQV